MQAGTYYSSSLQDFIAESPGAILARLTLAYAADGFSSMHSDLPVTWWSDVQTLQHALSTVVEAYAPTKFWRVVLEFTIPRKLRRIDAVLLDGEQIILLECKTASPSAEDLRQVEEYALLLHYFHQPSHSRRIVPVVVARAVDAGRRAGERAVALRQEELGFTALPSYWIAPTQVCSWEDLPGLLLALPRSSSTQNDSWTADWLGGAYRPTPTIIDAALALRTGLQVREIALSEAAEHEVASVTDEIRRIVDEAQARRQHAIVFLTGVPGSGKTLVGLGLAHLSESRTDAIHFMSGNGPLVAVLQEVFRRQGMRDGVPAGAAQVQAEALIENVHVFAKNYTERDPDRAPSNHVIIFDEAQRAWNLKQNLAKFARNYSEPEMLLKIMQRHEDWACVVALVGGGQEINSGEAGLEEWGKAIRESAVDWVVHASPEVLTGGTSTAGHRLFADEGETGGVRTNELLHLRTSNRSLRADRLAAWVNHVLAGDREAAASLGIAERYPLYLTRSLEDLRAKLNAEALGSSRFGLVGSSGAARLRADGLEPSSTFHAQYPWHHWYLAGREDVRSSFRCEVFATEFEIQGLELDWVGVCWGGDLVRRHGRWEARDLRHGPVTRWSAIRNAERLDYRTNAYRVLLTRARQGMVVYVPRGDEGDPTRDPVEFEATAEFLLGCGVRLLGGDSV